MAACHRRLHTTGTGLKSSGGRVGAEPKSMLVSSCPTASSSNSLATVSVFAGVSGCPVRPSSHGNQEYGGPLHAVFKSDDGRSRKACSPGLRVGLGHEEHQVRTPVSSPIAEISV